MGDFEKHFRLMNEKKDTAYGAFEKHNNSSVGDEAIKVVEQALEADAFRFQKGIWETMNRDFLTRENCFRENFSRR